MMLRIEVNCHCGKVDCYNRKAQEFAAVFRERVERISKDVNCRLVMVIAAICSSSNPAKDSVSMSVKRYSAFAGKRESKFVWVSKRVAIFQSSRW